MRRTDPADYGRVLQWARRERLLTRSDSSAVFVDFDVLDDRLEHLQRVFPEGTLHAVAIKANPLLGVLRHVLRRGHGLEAASFEEVLLAKRAGADNDRLVFDSPIKRQSEIDHCDRHLPGLVVNANRLDELPRYARCRHLVLGLRVNPLADTGAPGIYAVSDRGSKFGEPITRRREIIDAFVNTPALTGLHVHVGSEVRDIESAARAIASIFQLARQIDDACVRKHVAKRVAYVDIGGGFAVTYGADPQQGLDDYVRMLRDLVPDLQSRRLVTEYGRFPQAHAAWLVSDVEYRLRNDDGAETLMLHHGADMFVREVYSPQGPRHRAFVVDRAGGVRTGAGRRYALGGPLCFAGDFLDRDCTLPQVQDGDQLVIADVGANTFALWSKHCSRAFPKVIGYSLQRGEIGILKRRQTASQSIAFWT